MLGTNSSSNALSLDLVVTDCQPPSLIVNSLVAVSKDAMWFPCRKTSTSVIMPFKFVKHLTEVLPDEKFFLHLIAEFIIISILRMLGRGGELLMYLL
jgi:hypothetical protein